MTDRLQHPRASDVAILTNTTERSLNTWLYRPSALPPAVETVRRRVLSYASRFPAGAAKVALPGSWMTKAIGQPALAFMLRDRRTGLILFMGRYVAPPTP